MTPAETVRDARLKTGLSAAKFARLLGLGKHGGRMVYKWERGEAKPGATTMTLIRWLAWGEKMTTATISALRSSASQEKGERKIRASMPFAEQLSALEALIKSPPTNSRVIEFSPKLAHHILDKLNLKNRPKKPAKINQYISDLTDGIWGLTGDTVKFGNDGLLKDGQNRLSACVRANKPLTTHVVFGIDPRLFSRMDIGKNRNGADVFSIAGVKYANHVAAAVRWLLILDGDNPSDRGAQFSNEELLKAYQGYDSARLDHSIRAALAVKKTRNHPVGPLAALHYLFAQRDARKADAFFYEWANDIVKKSRSPSRYLQRRLVEIATASNNRVHENVRNALIIKAWNAYIAERAVSKAEMQHSVGDEMPVISG